MSGDLNNKPRYGERRKCGSKGKRDVHYSTVTGYFVPISIAWPSRTHASPHVCGDTVRVSTLRWPRPKEERRKRKRKREKEAARARARGLSARDLAVHENPVTPVFPYRIVYRSAPRAPESRSILFCPRLGFIMTNRSATRVVSTKYGVSRERNDYLYNKFITLTSERSIRSY